jgi:hypothetical protein
MPVRTRLQLLNTMKNHFNELRPKVITKLQELNKLNNEVTNIKNNKENELTGIISCGSINWIQMSIEHLQEKNVMSYNKQDVLTALLDINSVWKLCNYTIEYITDNIKNVNKLSLEDVEVIHSHINYQAKFIYTVV